MKSLLTLIRLKQQHLDEKRLALTRLEEEMATVKSMIDNIDIEMACESEAARGDADKAFGYGSYLAGARARRAGLEERTEQVRELMVAASDEVAEAFREMKRFELAQTLAEQRAAEEVARQEQATLDDVALTGYRRAKASDLRD